jgi:hypothetical protein
MESRMSVFTRFKNRLTVLEFALEALYSILKPETIVDIDLNWKSENYTVPDWLKGGCSNKAA